MKVCVYRSGGIKGNQSSWRQLSFLTDLSKGQNGLCKEGKRADSFLEEGFLSRFLKGCTLELY